MLGLEGTCDESLPQVVHFVPPDASCVAEEGSCNLGVLSLGGLIGGGLAAGAGFRHS